MENDEQSNNTMVWVRK